MTERIPNSLINNILSRTNIVDLINQRIKLTKQGKNFYAHCPFHQEKNPSFSVSAEKQFYYCFSCGAHGNAIDFLIHYEHLEFLESIQELASIHGIDISSQKNCSPTYHEIHQKKQILYNIMNNLKILYQKNLEQQSSIQAREYLKNRGLNIKIIQHFNIGFALNKWQNITKIFGISKQNQKILNQTGMIVTNNHGCSYDRFRERIMFPIHNIYGHVIGFGGRTLRNKIPKYLNSPDTQIFQKRNQLYGLYELKKKYQTPPYILLVEGYMDVISLTQFGIHYVVASLGTSTTITHMQLLYHYTERIVCCYDGDNSGYTAAWRTLNITLPYLTDTRTLSFVFLPNQEDPDTLIRKIGKQKFLKYIENAEPTSNFLFKKLLQKINIKTLEGRSKLGFLALPIINKIPGKILRTQLLQELGKKIGILDDQKLYKLSIQHNTNKKHRPLLIKHTTINILISLLIQNPTLNQLLKIEYHTLKKIQQNNITILIKLIQFFKKYPNATSGEILEYYRTENFYKDIKTFAIWDHMIPDHKIETTFIDTLTNLKKLISIERQEELIAIARHQKLTQQQQEELWKINKQLTRK